jgi:hypothetical protein
MQVGWVGVVSDKEFDAMKIVAGAEGSYPEELLTHTEGKLHDKPPIGYLSHSDFPYEIAHFLFAHQVKGLTITHPDGSQQKPHHSHSFWRGNKSEFGAKFLLITDQRILYIVGGGDASSEDYHRSFRYQNIKPAEAQSIYEIAFEDEEGRVYRFWDSGTRTEDIKSAREFMQHEMGEVKNILNNMDDRIERSRDNLNEVIRLSNQNKITEAKDSLSSMSGQVNDIHFWAKKYNLENYISESENLKKDFEITQNEIDEMFRERLESARKQAIPYLRERIAEQLNLDESQINIDHSTVPEKDGYLELVEDTHNRIIKNIKQARELENEFPDLPWEAFLAGLSEELTSDEGITRSELRKYRKTVENSEQILLYLDQKDFSHPSIDPEGWREAITIALQEQNPDGLVPIKKQIERLGSELWTRDHLYVYSWGEFEQLIGDLYKDLGYNTTVTQGTADLGVDVWAQKGEKQVAIQVKQFEDGNSVGRETLQKLSSTIVTEKANAAAVITSWEFAQTAKVWADDFPGDFQLINGEELIDLLSESEIPPPI